MTGHDLPTTIEASSEGHQGGQAMFIVTHGPERGRIIALPQAAEPIRVGRAASCEVRIDDPSLSRVHATVRCVRGEYFIRDEGSRNGTLHNGVKVDYAVPLVEGDRITLGDVRLRLTYLEDGEPYGAARAEAAPTRVDSAVRKVVMTPALRGVYDEAARAAKSLMSVLILGETGVGKEVLAEAIHEGSPRAGKELLSINCAALTESLLESELFGHERGAFTGAVSAKPGLLEAADGGTVFLDEVGELPMTTQAKLLRVLEERRVLRVGARASKAIDVRFVAATNRNLEDAVAAGTFRKDLYFRLNGITLVLPPLRERPGDVVELAEAFLVEASALAGGPRRVLTDEAKRALVRYEWPGNVRELRNAIQRAVVLTAARDVTADSLPASVTRPRSAPEPSPDGAAGPQSARRGVLLDAVQEAERQKILKVLEDCGGNQTHAAEVLGISRRTLVARLTEWGMTKPRRSR